MISLAASASREAVKVAGDSSLTDISATLINSPILLILTVIFCSVVFVFPSLAVTVRAYVDLAS